MVVPALGSNVIAKIPGGPIGAGIAGVALIWVGSKENVDGALKGVIVGTGAGLATLAVMQVLFGGKAVRATA